MANSSPAVYTPNSGSREELEKSATFILQTALTLLVSGDREEELLNSNTLIIIILKDSSVMSIWTYLTASPCYTTNTNKHDSTTNAYYKHD